MGIRNIKYIQILFLSIFLLTSCSSVSSVIWKKLRKNNSQYTKIEEVDQLSEETGTKAENIYLFSEGDSLDFEYEVLGTVAGEANLGAKEYLAESYLKYYAWESYANGIIGVKVDSSPFTNKIKRINGKAVKIKQDSLFFAKYGKVNDLNFLEDLNIKPKSKYSATQTAFFTIGVLYGILALIAVGFLIYMTATGRPMVNR